jgi:N-acylglucosamine 2-epimerase
MLDYMWERGWDKEHGGILYFRDVYNKPVQEYWQDMKFWWPHNETIIATLLAYLLTGNEKYARWHKWCMIILTKNFTIRSMVSGLVICIAMAV